MKSSIFNKIIFILACFFATGSTVLNADTDTSKITIPFDSDKWVLNAGAKIENYLGKKSLKLGEKKPGAPVGLGMATLKDIDFRNGIIEYDVAFDETRTFGGVIFRVKPDGKSYEKFYMRAHQSGNPDANQYMPIYNGIQTWQLYTGEQYSTPIKYVFNEWMHIKVVVAGKLADIYIQDMVSPELTVELIQEEMLGKLGLWGLNIGGAVRFANFTVTPMDNPEIKGTPKLKEVAQPGTVLSWFVSNTFDSQSLAGKTLLTEEDTKGLEFKTLESDMTGMTNLGKTQAIKKGQNTTFAKLVIIAQADQTKKMEFGFSDAVKVYLNNQLLFEGNDAYGSRDYRFLGTVGFYDALYLPLKKGENEILFAVTESLPHDGWGVQARFEDMTGIAFSK